MEIQEFDDTRFSPGQGILIVGGTGSGKSFWVKSLIENLDYCMKEIPDSIHYVYCFWQEHFSKLKDLGVKFYPSWDFEILHNPIDMQGGMLIIDDMADKLAQTDPNYLRELYCKATHHCKLTVITLLHHPFSKTVPHLREINLNSQITVLLSSPRSMDAIVCWARQIFQNQSKKFIQLYKNICEAKSYGYILLYISPSCPSILRIRSNIFPSEQPTQIYVLNEK